MKNHIVFFVLGCLLVACPMPNTAPASIELTCQPVSLKVTEETFCQATVKDGAGNTIVPPPSVAFASSSQASASISNIGIVTALAVGTTQIQATSGAVVSSAINLDIKEYETQSDIQAGGSHTCYLKSSGKAYCWGLNTYGQVGSGSSFGNVYSPEAVQAPTGVVPFRFKSISTGENHTCGLSHKGLAYCWGISGSGQLGSNAQNPRIPTPVLEPQGGQPLQFAQISAGNYHTCGITTAGKAYCWGAGIYGTLGTGTLSNSTRPVEVTNPVGEPALQFASIAATSFHTCAITVAGKAYCWGENNSGQGGDGTTTAKNLAPKAVSVSTTGQALVFKHIGVDGARSCGLTTTGEAYCWGTNTLGGLGDGTLDSSTKPIAVAAPVGGSVLTFSHLSLGSSDTCGVTETGGGYCWGSSATTGANYGNLSKIPVAVVAPAGGSVLVWQKISKGGLHGCGYTFNNAVYCWGNYTNGQIGVGNIQPDSRFPLLTNPMP
jgi:alpha-tubulin suppressor-like RCC1 family protein